jgi:hypothetical protein
MTAEAFMLRALNHQLLVIRFQNSAAEFVLQSPKLNSIQYRICTTGKSGPGGI